MSEYLIKERGKTSLADIKAYEATGGYGALKKAVSMKPGDIIEEIKKSGLRGRGGAGFPTHIKWAAAAADPKTPKYLLCNADEGEPGTFKDRVVLETNPHLLIESMAIAALAIGTEYGYVYLRGEYPWAHKILQGAIEAAASKGYIGENVLGSGRRFLLHIHSGAGAYICGEETALIESLEGRRGHPRIKPPFPVNEGYNAKPTIVNNVETLCNVTVIMNIGASEYAKIGTADSPGPKLFTISGHVKNPGVYEFPMGTTLKELIYEHAGGLREGRKLKAVIPGGVSTPVLPADKVEAPMDFSSLIKYGSMLGSGAVVVFDETACMVNTAKRIARFFEVESCGKCTPCREGTGWLRAVLEKIEAGHAKPRDLDLLLDIADNIGGKCFCALGDGAASSAINFVRHFRPEFEAHIKEKRCVIDQTGGEA